MLSQYIYPSPWSTFLWHMGLNREDGILEAKWVPLAMDTCNSKTYMWVPMGTRHIGRNILVTEVVIINYFILLNFTINSSNLKLVTLTWCIIFTQLLIITLNTHKKHRISVMYLTFLKKVSKTKLKRLLQLNFWHKLNIP